MLTRKPIWCTGVLPILLLQDRAVVVKAVEIAATRGLFPELQFCSRPAQIVYAFATPRSQLA